jgi:hypothetical protein
MIWITSLKRSDAGLILNPGPPLRPMPASITTPIVLIVGDIQDADQVIQARKPYSNAAIEKMRPGYVDGLEGPDPHSWTLTQGCPTLHPFSAFLSSSASSPPSSDRIEGVFHELDHRNCTTGTCLHMCANHDARGFDRRLRPLAWLGSARRRRRGHTGSLPSSDAILRPVSPAHARLLELSEAIATHNVARQ